MGTVASPTARHSRVFTIRDALPHLSLSLRGQKEQLCTHKDIGGSSREKDDWFWMGCLSLWRHLPCHTPGVQRFVQVCTEGNAFFNLISNYRLPNQARSVQKWMTSNWYQRKFDFHTCWVTIGAIQRAVIFPKKYWAQSHGLSLVMCRAWLGLSLSGLRLAKTQAQPWAEGQAWLGCPNIRKIKKKLIILSRLTTLISLLQQFKSF
jgi:hypothetical protein